MHLSLSLVTVIIVLLHSISVVKGGIFSWNRTEVCVSARKLNTRYEDRIVQVDTISQIITNNLKEAFPSRASITDRYYQCINKNYLEYHRPDIFKVMMPSVLVLIEEYKEIDPDINAALFHCKYLLKEAKDELKHSRFGPAYTGCDRFLPPFSSQGIRSWNLLVSQVYEEMSTREAIKELLPIYEAIVDRLTSVQQWFRWKKQC
uniref:Uncharacterized protein n=1 Tax=Trichobilharzia regenti TaxID=157069 RepID=A0AA85IRM2_TRIRE|nr:unnamed protein product [Trichobilharzia regenti]